MRLHPRARPVPFHFQPPPNFITSDIKERRIDACTRQLSRPYASNMETPEVFGRRLRDCLQERLCGAYTYMKHDVVDRLAQQCEKQMITLIEKE